MTAERPRESAEDETPTGDSPVPARMDEKVSALADHEGWRAEGYAARVHYEGAGDYYSVEYYAPSDCVLYWKVKGDGETAVPVARETVPEPLRQRIRTDLMEAGIDPEIEHRSV